MPGRDFESIYRDYSRLVYWAAYKVLNSAGETEDAAQDVFLAVLKNMELVNGMSDAQLKGWLYRVAVNAALDMKRKNTKELLSDEPLGAEVPDTGGTPEDEAVEGDTQAEVRAALDSVDAIYREPLYMFYYSGMSVIEIAEALGINEGTVKSRMARGRKLMAKRLNARGISYE
ncbi:MAG: sigma-70 family RNA polymerase sigma factor [Clostridiales bacterium]|nr:sigma-70 family RNA polymerase sigma factor [Clostridiales bacterium]